MWFQAILQFGGGLSDIFFFCFFFVLFFFFSLKEMRHIFFSCVSFHSQDELHIIFRSIKHYFLMDLGDFFVQFMDLAEDEMKKNMDGILWKELLTRGNFYCISNKNVGLNNIG